MARLTREQYNKWDAQAKNGFHFDLHYYVTWSEKTLIKNIKQDDGCIIQFKLWYMPEYETKTNEWETMEALSQHSKLPISQNLQNLKDLPVLHTTESTKEEVNDVILSLIKEKFL